MLGLCSVAPVPRALAPDLVLLAHQRTSLFVSQRVKVPNLSSFGSLKQVLGLCV